MKNISLFILFIYLTFAFSSELVEIYEIENKELLRMEFINNKDGIFYI